MLGGVHVRVHLPGQYGMKVLCYLYDYKLTHPVVVGPSVHEGHDGLDEFELHPLLHGVHQRHVLQARRVQVLLLGARVGGRLGQRLLRAVAALGARVGVPVLRRAQLRRRPLHE